MGSVGGRQVIGHQGNGDSRRDHVFGITAVERNACDLERDLAAKEIAAPASIAIPAVPTMPADTDALTFFPLRDTCADCIHNANDFVAGNSWKLHTWPVTFFDH